MNKLLTTNLRWLLLSLLLATGVGSAWGQTVLFHETFGDNSGSARAWNDSYSVKSGVSDVYAGITGYTITNAKQSKNTMGATASGLTQSSQGTDASIIIGPLNVANYQTLQLTYQWKAASIKGTYSTSAYYATSSTGTYSELTGTGTGATTFVERSYSLPAAAQVATLYIKIVWNTSNTQAIIDEVELTGTASGPSTTATTTSFPQASYLTSYPGTFSAPTATVKAGTTTVTSPAVTYSSSDESVATVNANTGAVTLVGIGSTTITANYAGNNTYSSSSGSYTLTVEDGRPTTSVSFLQDSYEAVMGQPFTSPTATLTPSGAGSLTYSSSNESVATVNSSTGEVTIAAAGSTMITASFEGNSNYKGSSATYTLVISDASSSTTGYSLYTGTLTEGDYIIYYNGKAMKASVSSNRLGYESVTPTNDVIETTESSIIWHIAQSGSYWTIYNAGTGKYAAANGTKNQAQLLESGTDDKSLWTVSGSSTYEFVNKSNAANNVNSNLRNNENYGFACYSTSTGGALSLYRYTSSETPESVSAPSLTAECSFWPNTTESPSKTITIAPVSEGSYVRYTTNGSDPTTSSGNLLTSSTDITINATTTVKAIAYYSDDVKSSVVSATYTLGQTVNSIADFKALGNETEARLYLSPEQNARVLHYSGNEIYLRDNTGAICLFLNSSLQKTIPAHDYHVAGWIIGKYQPYNGLPEMVATSNTTTDYMAFAAPVTETPTEPVAINADEFDDYKADWVKITDLRAESNNNVSDGAANTFKVYNKYGLNMPEINNRRQIRFL